MNSSFSDEYVIYIAVYLYFCVPERHLVRGICLRHKHFSSAVCCHKVSVTLPRVQSLRNNNVKAFELVCILAIFPVGLHIGNIQE